MARLGGVTQIEMEALLLVFDADHTAVFIDARDPEQYQSQTLQEPEIYRDPA
jgi:hypothetical protein